MRENVVRDKSKAFAIRIVRLYQYLLDEKKEYVNEAQLKVLTTTVKNS